ncbi:hypothetical protein EWM64_g10423 [Hericium alpestre]|uniref:Uncharacterized protein n=1 Tax=Hericium alpestre TaxID=135208 RepID=A0A4Y9ZJG6_9AGAM|nr:hypothetical protein EWM64_g10423 [Hericium alpestre]
MRRGDFIKEDWVMEHDPAQHVARVKEHLETGRDFLASRQEVRSYDIAGIKPDETQFTHQPPNPDDPFYVATDERDADALKAIAAGGAVFLNDLLTIEDRQAFGWPLMVTDVRALVEQALLARSAYFYAHSMSSVAGGIVNMRAARGADPRTTLLD